MTKALLAFFLLIGFSTFIFSQSDTSYSDTVKVFASRIPSKIYETGRNITVISQAEIAQLPATSIDDLLQYIPGIEVQSRNGFGVQGDITMRGATFTQILVLIDGMRLNDPLTAHFNNNIPVSMAEIERIEVLRGAAAAMFGADAVGGVINIVTKGSQQQSQDQSEISGGLDYGQHQLVSARQGFSIQRGRLHVGGGFAMNQSAGEPVDAIITENDTLAPYRNFFDIKTVSTSLSYRFNNGWSLRARTAFDHRDFSARYFYTASTFDQSTETVNNWWNQLHVSHVGKASKTDLNVGYKRNTDVFVFNPNFPSTNEHLTQYLNIQLNHRWTLDDKLALQVGTQVDRRSIESNDRGDHQDWHAGVFAVALYQPTKRLNINGSLRLDNDANYGTELSPQLNVSWVLPKVVFRSSIGRSIRAADYTERFVSTNLQNLSPGRSLGNPDLLAENGWSQELGMDIQVRPFWTIKATGFLRQASRLIDYVSAKTEDIPRSDNLRPDADYFFAQNLFDVQTAGFEFESWMRKKLSAQSRLSWSLGYTWINTSNDLGIVPVYISSHAGHLLNTSFIYTSDIFDLSLNGRYKVRDIREAQAINSRLEESYMVWNARVGVKLSKVVGLNVQVQNLFDTQYQDILGAKMPGRWLMAGVRFGIRENR
ncbi:MAG: TonB-dependent receptor plug domain-containing protein [Bacteroidia bacterium]